MADPSPPPDENFSPTKGRDITLLPCPLPPSTFNLRTFNSEPSPPSITPRYPECALRHGPVMASVRPSCWMFIKSVLPSGENTAPASSESLIAFRPSL